MCLQYNDVPGSDEEMELGLGSDASLASSCGKHFPQKAFYTFSGCLLVVEASHLMLQKLASIQSPERVRNLGSKGEC